MEKRGFERGAVRLALLAAAIAVGCPGCAILGRSQTDHPLPAAEVAKVEKGMTKSQVTDILGAPQEIIFSNKEHDPLREHAYVYEHKTQKATAIFFLVVNFGNLDEKRDRVVVFFGLDEKVSNVAKSLYGDKTCFGFPFGR
jgi:outer membrane protein assembly factor BamE (lipoprotein component of BamABCDE complex)